MANNLDSFEQLIKESFNNYEVPYNPEHWAELEEELNPVVAPVSVNYFASLATGLALTVLILGSFFFLISEDNSNESHQPALVEEEKDSEGTTSNNNEDTYITESVTNHAATAELETNSPEQSPIEEEIEKSGVNTKINPSPKPSLKGKDAKVAVKTSSKEATGKPTLKRGCTGLTIEFSSDEYGKDAKYLWNFGDGYFSNSANPVHTFNKPGLFDVSLSVTSKSSGQISSNVVQGSIEIVEAPDANFQLELLEAEQVTLKNSSSNASNVEWIIDNKGVEDGQETVFELAGSEYFTTKLIAVNENGCTDTLSRNVTISSQGKQNISQGTFMPDVAAGYDTFTFKVFDEAGKKVVYESNSKDLPWHFDKTSRVKNPWVLIAENPNGEIAIFKGTVSSAK